MYREAKQKIDEHNFLRHKVVVVSSSPIELVRPIAELFGIIPENVVATEVTLDAQGRYTREFTQWVPGKSKPGAVELFAQRNGIELPRSFGYTDSQTDIPFLGIFGHPHVVIPDEVPRDHPVKSGWVVSEFERPDRQVNRPIPDALRNPWVQAGAGVTGIAAVSTAGTAISRRLAATEG